MTAQAHVVEPLLPAVSDYPTESPWAAEVEKIRHRFLYELEHVEDGWIDLGEREGVRLWKKWHDNVRRLALAFTCFPAAHDTDLLSSSRMRVSCFQTTDLHLPFCTDASCPDPVPWVRGETVVEDVTPDAVRALPARLLTP